MMASKKQQNRIVLPLVILLVLLVVTLLAADPFGWRARPADVPDTDAPVVVPLCTVAAADITAFEIDPVDGEPFRLELAGEVWRARRGDADFRANLERIDTLLEQVPGLESTSLATDKAEKHATFEVGDATAVVLKVYTGDASPATHLLVGKATPDYGGSFVRLIGQDNVYRTSRNIKSLVGFAFDDFCTKQPWQFDTAAAEAITVAPPSGAGAVLSFNRLGGMWQTTDGANGNQNLLAELTDKISNLRITSVVDEADPAVTGLAEALPAVTITAGGEEYGLIIGAKEESQYYVADLEGHVYKLSEYNLKPYLELDFALLTFDDTAAGTDAADEALSGEMEPAEGVVNGLPSDIDQ